MCWSINDVIFYVSSNTKYRWSMTNRCVMSDKLGFNPAPCNLHTDGQEVIIWNLLGEMAPDTIIKHIVY
jgi:hypothetical protein